jgi:GDP-4-dehydro-6-deoxy-D-mannose reductase
MQSKQTILITGACGMVGSHLGEYYFHQHQIKCIGTRFNATIDTTEVDQVIDYIDCDIRDQANVLSIISTHLPDVIYHLAAQSYPTVSWDKPIETMDINVNGTINVYESIIAIRKQNPSYDPMVVVACSSAEYGSSLTPENTPVPEDTTLLPLHPYGVSKVSQDLLTYQYFVNNKIRGIRARIFNTTGVRKVQDVASEFTRRAVQLEKGLIQEFRVGNLSTKRAIADVRDLVNALVLLADKGVAGEVYNISGNNVYQISELIDTIEQIIERKIQTTQDPSLMRSTDEPVIYGDSSRLIAQTGWSQQIPLKKTLEDMIAYWRWKMS